MGQSASGEGMDKDIVVSGDSNYKEGHVPVELFIMLSVQ